MRMTPLEIQSHRFARRLRGYDREEVDSFLRLVTEDYEAVLMVNESQRNRLRILEERLSELTNQEQLLKQTLLEAQSMSENMRVSAKKESELLLTEAELRAEQILEAAHRRVGQLNESIREMRGLRTSLGESLRCSIETHLGLVENLTRDTIQIESVGSGLHPTVVTERAESAATSPKTRAEAPPQPAVRPSTQAAAPAATRSAKPGEPQLSRFKPSRQSATRGRQTGPTPSA